MWRTPPCWTLRKARPHNFTEDAGPYKCKCRFSDKLTARPCSGAGGIFQRVCRFRLSKRSIITKNVAIMRRGGTARKGALQSRPRKVALQRCLLYGNALRGVEDAAPYKCKYRFFNKLQRVSRLTGGAPCDTVHTGNLWNGG